MATKNKNTKTDTPAIRFPAIVASVKTLVDGGIRIVFDIPEDAISAAASLMACKREGIPLKVEVMADGEP